MLESTGAHAGEGRSSWERMGGFSWASPGGTGGAGVGEGGIGGGRGGVGGGWCSYWRTVAKY